MKTTFLKRTAAASLSVVLAASVPFTVLADQTDPNVAYEQEQQLLSDGHLDYGEIEGRVKNYYGPMKSAYDMAKGMVEDQADIAVNERIMANDLLSQADVAEDMAEEQTGMDQAISAATAKALRQSARQMRNAASMMGQSLKKTSSTERQVDRQANSLIMNVQSMMNQYEQLVSQRAMAAKGVEQPELFRIPCSLRGWRWTAMFYPQRLLFPLRSPSWPVWMREWSRSISFSAALQDMTLPPALPLEQSPLQIWRPLTPLT